MDATFLMASGFSVQRRPRRRPHLARRGLVAMGKAVAVPPLPRHVFDPLGGGALPAVHHVRP
jgi:hypothetical protein